MNWERHEHAGANKADYRLIVSGRDTGIEVKWCGHPTAHRPYYITGPGTPDPIEQAYRTARLAQAAALTCYLKREGRAVPPDALDGLTP